MTDTFHHRFLEPLDVLFLRGNKLFGDPGSFGESLVPPWPSVAAGALRSAMLAREGIDPAAFAQGMTSHPTLGTPREPGSFAIVGLTLARRAADASVESMHALPADLVAETDGDGRVRDLRRLTPVAPAAGLMSSAPLPRWPVLAQGYRGKPAAGVWLTQAGWVEYLAGRIPRAEQTLTSANLWSVDPRVGVGLDTVKRRAADRQLFTVQAVALQPGVGFLATVAGSEPPSGGVLRFGGDGRGAALTTPRHRSAGADLSAIARAGRARVVLTTPGLFADGWCIPGTDVDMRVQWPGLSARLVCAAVPRADVVSGWDLAARQPKTAERAAPAGSVYWLDDLEATPEALRKLAERGLWPDDHQNTQRRAEGFNRFTFAAW
ncbi:MAG: type III-B CRISPR module-associated protein Cmr3 [Rubrivivax sp.]|nr:type III-B CRISPR module-associated protein Cmr3 [Rubrivivax sp.]